MGKVPVAAAAAARSSLATRRALDFALPFMDRPRHGVKSRSCRPKGSLVSRLGRLSEVTLVHIQQTTLAVDRTRSSSGF